MKHRHNHGTAATDNGIRLKQSPRVYIIEQQSPLIQISAFILPLLGVFGTVFSFLSMFPVPYYRPAIVITAVLFCLLWTAFYFLPGKASLLTIPFFLLGEYFITRNHAEIREGFCRIYNAVYKQINKTDLNFFETTLFESDPKRAVTVFLIAAIFLLSLLINAFGVRWPNVILSILLTFPFVELGLYFGFEPNLIAFTCLLAFWVSVLVQVNTGLQKYNNRTRQQCASLAAVFVCVMVFCIQTILSASGYQRSETVNQIRTDLKAKINSFSFDDIATAFDDLPFSFGLNASDIDDYDRRLGDQKAVTHNHQTDLTVTVSQPLKNNIYLRGYVGTVYTGHGWTQFDEDVIDQNMALFSSFSENGIFPQEFLPYREYFFIGNETPTTIRVSTTNKKLPYNFLPYGALGAGDYRYVEDTRLLHDDTTNYSIQFFDKRYTAAAWKYNLRLIYGTGSIYNPDHWLVETLTSYSSESFINTENEYREFVLAHYLTLPQNEAMEEIKTAFIDSGMTYEAQNEAYYYMADQLAFTNGYPDSRWLPYSKEADIKEMICKQVAQTLTENAAYTLSPGKTPANRDFVQFFLQENHKGYCSYFATAGAVLCRMYGIPARYVEGYVVLESDCNETTKNGDSYVIEIEDTRAHAWVEIYLNSLGWIPVEFTPGGTDLFEMDHNPGVFTTSSAESTISTTSSTVTTTHQSEQSTTFSTATKATTAAQSSSTTSAGTQGDNQPFFTPAVLRVIARILLCAVIIALLVLIVYLRYRKAVEQRRTMRKDPDRNRSVRAEYCYQLQLLALKKLMPKNQHATEFAKTVDDSCDWLENGAFLRAAEIALEAEFSDHAIKEEDAEYIRTLSDLMIHKLKEESSLLRLFYLRFIRVLID
ncbi:MAG: transglutaminase domain-containing protein [Ruminococcus sp.]|nr:transglutaminase domain-containing protein [Ruminococcus sp.]